MSTEEGNPYESPVHASAPSIDHSFEAWWREKPFATLSLCVLAATATIVVPRCVGVLLFGGSLFGAARVWLRSFDLFTVPSVFVFTVSILLLVLRSVQSKWSGVAAFVTVWAIVFVSAAMIALNALALLHGTIPSDGGIEVQDFVRSVRVLTAAETICWMSSLAVHIHLLVSRKSASEPKTPPSET